MEFKDKLKELRIKNGMTQEDLALKLNVSRQAISKYETGRNFPNFEIMSSMASLFNCSVDDLLSQEEIAKETVIQKSKAKKNKIYMLILLIIAIIGIVSGIVSLIISIVNKRRFKINHSTSIVGYVYKFDDEELDLNKFLTHEYFGYYFDLDGNEYSNLTNYSIVYSNTEFDCSFYIYITSNVKTISFYTLYYNSVKREYTYFDNGVYTITDSDIITSSEKNHRRAYTFEANIVVCDVLKDLTIKEYGESGNLIKTTNSCQNLNSYKIDTNMLYLVCEETLLSDDDEIVVRSVIFNNEITETGEYYFLLKIPNNENIIDSFLVIER